MFGFDNCKTITIHMESAFKPQTLAVEHVCIPPYSYSCIAVKWLQPQHHLTHRPNYEHPPSDCGMGYFLALLSKSIALLSLYGEGGFPGRRVLCKEWP